MKENKGLIKSQTGFSVVILLLLVVLVAAAAFSVWKIVGDKEDKTKKISSFAECVAAGNPVMEIYPEQCAAGGQTFVNPEQETTQGSLEEYQASDAEIPFADLPAGLQDAIQQKLASTCSEQELAHGDALYTYSVATKESFVDNKYATVMLTCGAGSSAALYAVKDEKWHFVATTQDNWPCDALVEYGIPASYIAECMEEIGQPAIPNPVKS